MNFVLNLLGIAVVIGFMWLISFNRKAVNFKRVGIALAFQVLMAGVLVKLPAGRAVIEKVSDAVVKVLGYGSEGIQFVFGSLGMPEAPTGFIFAFQTLANIVFISGLVGVLY